MKIKMYLLMALPLIILGGILAFSVWLGKKDWRNGKEPRPWVIGVAERIGLQPGMNRADEMERMIQYKAVSWAYLVVMIGLAALNFYEVFVNGGKLPLTNLILLAGVLTQSISVLVLRNRSTQGDEEYKLYPLWKTLAIVLGFSVAVAALGALFAIAIMVV